MSIVVNKTRLPVTNWQTKSGAVVSIDDARQRLARSLKVHMLPRQDLHGYDNPWPPGGGVNKLDPATMVAHVATLSGLAVTISNGVVNLSGTWTGSTSGGARAIDVPSAIRSYNVKGFESTGHVSARWQSGEDVIVFDFVNMVNGNSYNFNVYVVVYEGGTVPASWSPYSNICPISGRTGCEVSVSKTAVPAEYQPVEYIESTGMQYINTGLKGNQDTGFDITFYTNNDMSPTIYGCIFGSRKSSGVDEYQLTTYSASATPQGSLRIGNKTAGDAGLSKQVIQTASVRNGVYTKPNGTTVSVSPSTFETPYNIYLFALNNNNSVTQQGSVRIYCFKLYSGNTLIAHFVPCYRKADSVIGMYDIIRNIFFTNSGTGTFLKGSDSFLPNQYNTIDVTTYPISWQTEAGTVYGGRINYTTGVLVAEWVKAICIGDESEMWAQNGSGSNFISMSLFDGRIKSTTGAVITSVFKESSAVATDVAVYNGGVLNFHYNAVLNLSGWKTFLSNLNTAGMPLEVIYKLATPITIHLTPQQIQMLVRDNTIWSDADSVEVEYAAVHQHGGEMT